MEKIYRRYDSEPEEALEYGWVFGITFFLVLFLSQTLSIWVFGEVGSIFSWIILLLWSLAISYFLLFGSGTYVMNRLHTFVDNAVKKRYLVESRTDLSRVPEIKKMESVPRDNLPEKEKPKDAVSILEDRAHDMGALISHDALLHIADLGRVAEDALEMIISMAKKENPRFDGWVVLNKEQVEELLERGQVNGDLQIMAEENNEEEIFLGDIDRKNNVIVPANLPTGKLQSDYSLAAASFMELLCAPDEQGLFTFMRKMRQGNPEDTHEFIKETILMLDRVHEHRVDGAGYVNKEVLEHTRCFSNQEIEEVIAILIGSVDYRYSVPEIGVKLSLMRALEYIKKARKT